MATTWQDELILKLHWAASKLSYGVVNYRHPLRTPVLNTVQDAQSKVWTVTMPVECAEICQAVIACDKVPGDIAEAGVFLGGTARLILQASRSQKRIHLFDTFEGLPYAEDQFHSGEYNGPLGVVEQNLSEFRDRLEFHPGFFPDSTAGLDDLRFSFVHLDLDLYQGTLAALEWFWPRMHPGGILICHDYPFSAGVVRAFEEFFATQPEPYIPLSGGQCMAVKCSSALPISSSALLS